MSPEFWWPGGDVAGPIAIRLVSSLVLGAIVAWIYRKARKEPASSFTATLVLLSVLIAMVTQVIGDNVARAFSLVGALSIVRFRTVVRDTQDTAYVIFAVAVGMLPLTGTSSAEHMRLDLGALDFPIERADLELLDSIAS